ncbi:MAG: winged helix-turn-helix domain-containing protein [Elusimicrobia bacterium]|nr:winged helix-turn-helix domain-containing protein [Elusimicrobiota bacterium]
MLPISFFEFYIISPDTALCRKWEKAFLREDWKINFFENFSEFNASYTGERGLVFIEVGSNANGTLNEIKKSFFGKNLSIITFADEKCVNNSLITVFLESCSDDFILKSLDEKILVAKTKAHLRRLLPSMNYVKTIICTKKGDVQMDRNKGIVKLDAKTKKSHCLENLTLKEFKILAILINHEEEIISRALILENIWEQKSEKVNAETIDKHIESLRKKLGAHGKKIKTMYGLGYAFKNS